MLLKPPGATGALGYLGPPEASHRTPGALSPLELLVLLKPPGATEALGYLGPPEASQRAPGALCLLELLVLLNLWVYYDRLFTYNFKKCDVSEQYLNKQNQYSISPIKIVFSGQSSKHDFLPIFEKILRVLPWIL